MPHWRRQSERGRGEEDGEEEWDCQRWIIGMGGCVERVPQVEGSFRALASAGHTTCTASLSRCLSPHFHSIQIEELTLKSGASTELKILFDEPWLVQVGEVTAPR